MYGPLLISLLPPEKIMEATGANTGCEPVIAVFLLIGLLFSLFLRNPEH